MTALAEQRTGSPVGPGRRIEVLHVLPGMGLGGAERVVATLLRQLDRSWCCPALCVLGSENAFPARLEGLGEIEFLGYRGSLRDVMGSAKCVWRLRRMIQRRRARMVHSHLWPAVRIASLAAARLGVRHVVHIHDTRPWLEGSARRDRMLRRLTKAALALSRPAYVAVSHAAKKHACANLGIPPEKVEVIHNGVDLEEFSPENGRTEPDRHNRPRAVIGMAARFGEEKGHDCLLHAAAELARRGMDFELRLAGDGGLRPVFERTAAALGVAERVRFSGLVEDMPRWLAELDLFTLPSLCGEGLPMTILEAMAMGLPVAATPIAGVPEVVRHGHNGLLVPPGDPIALADALGCLAGDEPLRRRLGGNGLATVRDGFSAALNARRLERFYAELG